MQNEQLIKEISLFFFFSLLDEEKAFEAAQKTWTVFQDYKKKYSKEKDAVLIVQATKEVWDHLNPKLQKGRPYLTKSSGWTWPNQLNMGPWMEFQKHSTTDELLSTIWCYIMGYSESDVATGLGLSEGTLRFRLGHSVKKVGALV